MKNKIIKLAGVATAVIALAQTVQATPITGSIGFAGTYVQNDGTPGVLSTATSYTVNQPPIILSATGAFIGAASPTYYSPILNDTTSLVGQTLWTFVVGSVNYSFMVTTESETFPAGNQVNFTGLGYVLDGNPNDKTLGSWQIGLGVNGLSFTFQSTSAAPPAGVPDGGTTVLLLGAALSGLALVKRKMTA